MSKLSRSTALEYISNWSTNDVINLLKKNGLEDLCQAVLKRQIDGDELMHLTEGKLALWKSDLTRAQTWNLWTFVEEIHRVPEDYVSVKNPSHTELEVVSDSGSWGTDFEDDDEEDNPAVAKNEAVVHRENVTQHNATFRNSLMMFQKQEQANPNLIQAKRTSPPSIYMNYELKQKIMHEENAYMNFEQSDKKSPSISVSQLHKKFETSHTEKLNELKLQCPFEITKPLTTTKPADLALLPKSVKTSPCTDQKSFLHASSSSTVYTPNSKDTPKPITPPPRPEKSPSFLERRNDLPKPPLMIRNLDLVANLPTAKTDDSEDEYEAFDEDIIEQNRQKIVSQQAKGSVESVFKPPSTTNDEDEEEYEIYECITENPDDHDYYIQPISQPVIKSPPLSLPATSENPEPLVSTSTLPKTQNKLERPIDKKSATLPQSGTNACGAEMRATRPLPPTPYRQSYLESSWFHDIAREQATALIQERAHSSTQNGYFLLRPSTFDSNCPLVLVLWYNDRVYNVPVRKRPDGRYALGFLKANEQTFTDIEDIVKFHTQEELVLYSGGRQMGSTKLTNSPSK